VIGQATVGAGETAESRAADEAGKFEAAFRQVGHSAFLLARQLGRSTDEAMDIVQEAALRGWRYRSTRKGEFRPWFLTIVYRLSRQRMTDWFPLPPAWDPPAPTSIESNIDPDLLTLGTESFVADLAVVGAARHHNGLIALGEAAIGTARTGSRGSTCTPRSRHAAIAAGNLCR